MDENSFDRTEITRRLVLGGAGAAIAVPLIVHAQASKPLRVGFASPRAGPLLFLESMFKERMKELGYIEGQSIIYESVRIDNFDPTNVFNAYSELSNRSFDIVFAHGPSSVIPIAYKIFADKRPIVFASPDFDPVANGIAPSYRKPGGKITGVYSVQVELTSKRLQLMTEALPGLTNVLVFWDRLSAAQWKLTPSAARAGGLKVHGIEFKKRPYDYAGAYELVPKEFRTALLTLASPGFALPKRNLLPDFAITNELPTMFALAPYVRSGGLMSYGVSFDAIWRGAADYIHRIARGTSPADLPIVQPTQFEFAVNLKTARALGVSLPEEIMFRTTEVIS